MEMYFIKLHCGDKASFSQAAGDFFCALADGWVASQLIL